MARATMADLIQEVRGLTGAGPEEYTVGSRAYWDDDQVQALLDRHRRDVDHEMLHGAPTHYSGGSLCWQQYRSEYGRFEATDGGTAVFIVEDSNGTDAGTANYRADYVQGLVTFNADQRGTIYYLTGRVYDVYGAAAELLRAWATKLSLQFDFSADGQSFKPSQKAAGLRDAATEYEAKAWVASVSMDRSDSGDGGPFLTRRQRRMETW